MPRSEAQKSRRLRELLGPDVGKQTKTYLNQEGKRVWHVRCAYCWWHAPTSRRDPGKRWRFTTDDPQETHERWALHVESTPHKKAREEALGRTALDS